MPDSRIAGSADVHASVALHTSCAGGAAGLGLDPVVRALTAGDVRTRVAVLPVASLLPGDRIRVALRAALADPVEPVRTAAVPAPHPSPGT